MAVILFTGDHFNQCLGGGGGGGGGVKQVIEYDEIVFRPSDFIIKLWLLIKIEYLFIVSKLTQPHYRIDHSIDQPISYLFLHLSIDLQSMLPPFNWSIFWLSDKIERLTNQLTHQSLYQSMSSDLLLSLPDYEFIKFIFRSSSYLLEINHSIQLTFMPSSLYEAGPYYCL